MDEDRQSVHIEFIETYEGILSAISWYGHQVEGRGVIIISSEMIYDKEATMGSFGYLSDKRLKETGQSWQPASIAALVKSYDPHREMIIIVAANLDKDLEPELVDLFHFRPTLPPPVFYENLKEEIEEAIRLGGMSSRDRGIVH